MIKFQTMKVRSRFIFSISSYWRCSKRGVLNKFAKFTGKHMYQNLFFKKVTGLRFRLRKEALTQVFSCKFCEIFKQEHLLNRTHWDDCFCFNLISTEERKFDKDSLFQKPFRLQVFKFKRKDLTKVYLQEREKLFRSYVYDKNCHSFRGVFTTLSNIFNGSFFENS